MHGTRQDPNSKPSQDASGAYRPGVRGTGPAWLVILSRLPSRALFFSARKREKQQRGPEGTKATEKQCWITGPARPRPGPACHAPSPLPVRPRPAGWGGARPCRGPWGKRNPKRHACEEGPGPRPHPCVHRKRTSRTCRRSARTHRRAGPVSCGPYRQRDRIGAPL